MTMLTATACADNLNELFNIPPLRCIVSSFKRRGWFLHENATASRTICSNEIIGSLAVIVHLTVTRSRPAYGTKPIILSSLLAQFWDAIGRGTPTLFSVHRPSARTSSATAFHDGQIICPHRVFSVFRFTTGEE